MLPSDVEENLQNPQKTGGSGTIRVLQIVDSWIVNRRPRLVPNLGWTGFHWKFELSRFVIPVSGDVNNKNKKNNTGNLCFVTDFKLSFHQDDNCC